MYISISKTVSHRYSLLHLECHSISISNLNLLGLVRTERGKRDPENQIIDCDFRMKKRHSKCNRLYNRLIQMRTSVVPKTQSLIQMYSSVWDIVFDTTDVYICIKDCVSQIQSINTDVYICIKDCVSQIQSIDIDVYICRTKRHHLWYRCIQMYQTHVYWCRCIHPYETVYIFDTIWLVDTSARHDVVWYRCIHLYQTVYLFDSTWLVDTFARHKCIARHKCKCICTTQMQIARHMNLYANCTTQMQMYQQVISYQTTSFDILPVAFGVSFLHSQSSIDDLVL